MNGLLLTSNNTIMDISFTYILKYKLLSTSTSGRSSRRNDSHTSCGSASGGSNSSRRTGSSSSCSVGSRRGRKISTSSMSGSSSSSSSSSSRQRVSVCKCIGRRSSRTELSALDPCLQQEQTS